MFTWDPARNASWWALNVNLHFLIEYDHRAPLTVCDAFRPGPANHIFKYVHFVSFFNSLMEYQDQYQHPLDHLDDLDSLDYLDHLDHLDGLYLMDLTS